MDTNLINVFLLVYPLQFICGMMKSIFSTGANICQEKEKNKNIVLSAMTTGIIIGAVLF
ncbi:MAG: hypothetical protein LBD11_06150 [Candidatus Peribacteria bacterium]|nr:hypothetical protein [Candidatus Peribacteria bacterium]